MLAENTCRFGGGLKGEDEAAASDAFRGGKREKAYVRADIEDGHAFRDVFHERVINVRLVFSFVGAVVARSIGIHQPEDIVVDVRRISTLRREAFEHSLPCGFERFPKPTLFLEERRVP